MAQSEVFCLHKKQDFEVRERRKFNGGGAQIQKERDRTPGGGPCAASRTLSYALALASFKAEKGALEATWVGTTRCLPLPLCYLDLNTKPAPALCASSLSTPHRRSPSAGCAGKQPALRKTNAIVYILLGAQPRSLKKRAAQKPPFASCCGKEHIAAGEKEWPGHLSFVSVRAWRQCEQCLQCCHRPCLGPRPCTSSSAPRSGSLLSTKSGASC